MRGALRRYGCARGRVAASMADEPLRAVLTVTGSLGCMPLRELTDAHERQWIIRSVIRSSVGSATPDRH